MRTLEKMGEEGREIDDTESQNSIKFETPLKFQPVSPVDIAVIPSRKIEIFLDQCTIFIGELQDLQSHLFLLKVRTYLVKHLKRFSHIHAVIL